MVHSICPLWLWRRWHRIFVSRLRVWCLAFAAAVGFALATLLPRRPVKALKASPERSRRSRQQGGKRQRRPKAVDPAKRVGATPLAGRGRPLRLPRNVACNAGAGTGTRPYHRRAEKPRHLPRRARKRRPATLTPDPWHLKPAVRRVVVQQRPPVLHYLDLGGRALAPGTWHLEPGGRQPASAHRRPHPMTEKRQAALRAAQISGAWAHKRDRSFYYASGFRHGRYVADPSRALPLSGATQTEYDAHLAIYDIGLHPVTERQDKLARATGMVSWKWLTALRLYGDTEVLGVWECLDRLAAERQVPFEVNRKLTPARLMGLVHELDRVFERWLWWEGEVAPLDHRLMQLLRQGIVERGAPRPRIKSLRPSRTVENFAEHSAEELASPGCWAKGVKARLAAEPAFLPPAPAERSEAASQPTSALGSTDTAPSGVQPFLKPLAAPEKARRELDREKRGEEGRWYAAVTRARQAGTAIPGDYQDFVRRVEDALGEDAPADGDRDAELVREIAAALWQRMTVFRRYGEKLDRALSLRLIDSAENPALPYDRAGFAYATEVAWEVVAHAFGHFQARAARAASAADQRLAAGFYALSVERWGLTAECRQLAEEGLPTRNERSWAWDVTHPRPGREMPHLDFTDTADQFLRAVELLRAAGVDVGQTIPEGHEAG